MWFEFESSDQQQTRKYTADVLAANRLALGTTETGYLRDGCWQMVGQLLERQFAPPTPIQ